MRIREAEAWVRELATRLGEHGVRVEQVILFGSLARGDYLEDSDIDLIIVSPDWHGVEYTRRLRLLYTLWDKPVDPHFIPLTPQELEEKTTTSTTLRDAKKYWKPIPITNHNNPGGDAHMSKETPHTKPRDHIDAEETRKTPGITPEELTEDIEATT